MLKNFLLSLTLLCTTLNTPLLSAHLDAGEDKVVNGHLVDFGYTPAEPLAGSPGQIAFNLVDPGAEAPIAFDHLWVRISNADRVIFAGTFFPEVGHVVFTQTFPAAGAYGVTVRFKAQNKIIAETSFDLQVKAAEHEEEKENFWGRIRRFFAEPW